MYFRMLLGGLAASCVILLAACAADPTTSPTRTVAPLPTMNAAPPATSQRPQSYDDELEALVDQIPGFGGWFIDTNGIPTVNLVDTRQRDVAQRVLAQRLAAARQARRPDGRTVSATMQARQVAFDFRELRSWSRAAERLLDADASAVYVDVNEQTNRVEIGVADAAGAARITAALRAEHVPLPGVEVLVVERSRSLQGGLTLADRVRPLPGGVDFACTLGFNANRGGVLGFVTASHCTNVFASAASPRVFWQAGDPLGEETYDPAPWQMTADCLGYQHFNPGGVCRYSDAAFSDYRYFAPGSVDFGYVARTLYVLPIGQMGSFTINQSNPHFEVVGKYYSIPVGVYVYRVAAASGWTIHNTSSACTTEYVQATSLAGIVYRTKLWCQYRTGGGSRSGDSGGPIFASVACAPGQTYRFDGTECVLAAGINWGEVSGVHRTLFSPISGVETDLGALGVRPIDRPY